MNSPSLHNSDSPLIRQAGRLIAEGRTDETLRMIQHSIQTRPASGTVWRDAGVLLSTMNRYEEALQHFQRARQFPDCPRQIPLDMARTWLVSGHPECAVQMLEPLASEGLLEESLVEQIVSGFAQQQDWASSMETLNRASKRLPDSEVLAKLQDQVRRRRAKIAFFCGADGDTFLRDILDYARKRYQVRVFDGTDTKQMFELMQWSDMSWFEWCTNLAQLGSAMPKVCRNIIRLHRYEAYMPMPRQIRWENVDLLITVGNSFVIKALQKWVPDIQQHVAIATIPNGVSLDKVTFAPRRPGKNIAFVASLRMVKNPMLLLQCMARLCHMDPAYRLFIAGDKSDLLMEHYVDYQIDQLGLRDRIIFDGWQNDIRSWLADKHYLAVTSCIESQGMGCLEAMACGIRPVIHNFPGSREIYGERYLFNTPEEFCRHIMSEDYNSLEYREFVERRYPLTRQLAQINEVFASFESNPFRSPQSTVISEN
ncbi:MAG TPA: glycosyltransferase [Anaerohalosphaeraceae bacterium]|nr:glycosyltransferase [Anaerohalosphaeraceae bacterium]